MKILAYGPEKTKGQYLRKMILPILGIAAADFVLLFFSMVLVVISEKLLWLTVTGIISILVLSLIAAIWLGIHLEKEKHVYWIDESLRVFRLDSGVRFLENPESCRGGTLDQQVKEFRQWAESQDQIPVYAPEIVKVTRMVETGKGLEVTFLEKRRKRKRLRKRRITVSLDWINWNRLILALQRLGF